MSLYYEAASIIQDLSQEDVSLKSKVYGAKNLKAPAAQVYALLSETTKWNEVINEVVERSNLLQDERKITPALALLLVHDLLLAKKGVAAPAAHPLRVSVERHRARLKAEFTKARLRRGCATNDALRSCLQTAVRSGGGVSNHDASTTEVKYHHPRWVRINTLNTDLETQLETTFKDLKRSNSLRNIVREDNSEDRLFYIDDNIPNLIALSPNVDLTSSAAYLRGEIIFQDKASCFPAYLLNPVAEEGDIVDACAAPGNKTTHLAALAATADRGFGGKIWACEKDKLRAETLKKMVSIAGADPFVSIQTGQDFLKLNPQQEPWSKVGALLLDPSCSGSGIIGREKGDALILPSTNPSSTVGKRSKKKKAQRKPEKQVTENEAATEVPEEVLAEAADASKTQERLRALSTFQTKILLHAFAFQSARKVVYSTCSVHDDENEHVVTRALQSAVAKDRGWRILMRHEQVSGMRAWRLRGRPEACSPDEEGRAIAEACIRCSKFTEDGTQGFFVAGFVRDKVTGEDNLSSDEEWEGFDD